jgi:flagellar biosynthesis GTPase FlhF
MQQEKVRQELEFENDQVQNQSRITHESEEVNDNTFTQDESV